MMSRTKIKGDEYICSKCDDMCSEHIRKSRFTKEELSGHMEYMKRSDRIYNEIILPSIQKHDSYPSATQRQGIEFFDDFGMFRIIDGSRDSSGRYPTELFRYDQVESYEIYVDEDEPDEPGKPKEFIEAGIKITLVGNNVENTFGKEQKASGRESALRVHPYITEPITVCFAKNEREKEDYFKYADNVITHFNYIFGVNEGGGLFSFGMSKAEKRDLLGAVAFVKTAASAVKAAKDGEVSEETKAEIEENFNKMEDAASGGLAVYTRAADSAEAKIQ